VDGHPGAVADGHLGDRADGVTSPTPVWRTWAPGVRVVVRRRRDDVPDDAPPARAGGEPRFTDVLGDVVAVDDDGLVVRTRHGDVHVPASSITLAKTVPPAPPRRGRAGG